MLLFGFCRDMGHEDIVSSVKAFMLFLAVQERDITPHPPAMFLLMYF